MGTEERAAADDHLDRAFTSGGEASHGAASGVVEKWLQNIRARIPAGAVLSATVRSKPRNGYYASFRLLNEGEVISSEARAESAEEAVEKAGAGLCQHLPVADLGDDEEGFYLAG